MLSVPHMIVVFLVVLVVFGPQKLPELARSLGKLMAEFRKASTDFKSAFEDEMRDLERQSRLSELRKQAADALTAATTAETTAANAQSGQGVKIPPYAMPAPHASGNAELPTPFAEEKPLTDGPVITPVAEAVARTEASSSELENAESAANDGANNGNATKESVAATESTPSHDEQQPA
jgi:sec-independent protein translocase protein TatB